MQAHLLPLLGPCCRDLGDIVSSQWRVSNCLILQDIVPQKQRRMVAMITSWKMWYSGVCGILRESTSMDTILRGADLAGLYRGGCITLLRDIPAHAVYFTSYELCHELFEPGSRLTGIHSPAALFMSGEYFPGLNFLLAGYMQVA